MRERGWEIWALPALLVLAAAHFAARLGAPSFFVDEALSVEHATPGFSGIAHAVEASETTPYTYFFGLHLWLGHGGSAAEASVRLPSVIAGVLLVAAVFWTARVFVERRVALGAALLCALSPFVFTYAQQARVYVFAMLATTLAVGATVRGAGAAEVLRDQGARPLDPVTPVGGRWLWAGGLAAVVALLCHYTATFAIAPLAVWLATRGAVDRRARIAYVAACVVTELLLAPLLVHQYRLAPNGGDLADAGLTGTSLARVFSVPFDGRWVAGVDWLRVLGLVTTLAAAAVVATRGRAKLRGLLLAVGFAAPIGLLLAGILGKDVLITRYAAAGVPVLLIAVAAAVAALPRPAAAALAALVAVTSAAGLIRDHDRTSGFYPPTRAVIDYIGARAQPGDAIVVPGAVGTDIPLAYYAQRRLHPLLPFVEPADSRSAFDGGGRVWIIRATDAPGLSERALLGFAGPGLQPYGYRPVLARAFDTSLTLSVILAEPLSEPAP
ncbi:MAG: mannosyltransferase [Solirubrobacteraceae bacterium]|nr:mannosyltransferase [Solirubrobacteraceae bacterium]